MLTKDQIDFFNDNGYLVVEDAISPEQLQALRDDFAAWVEDSKSHDGAWGEIRCLLEPDQRNRNAEN